MSEQRRNEKRDFYRMHIGTDLDFNFPGDDKAYRGFCRNLSHSGIQFDTSESLSKGQVLEVKIDSRSNKIKPFVATIDVIRVEHLGNKQYRIAAKILNLK